ncbi:helix-turn-helix domain-containing protein [Planctomycetes bacterium TBK1r]|uniref:HTH cro/C1-type domain-containing protein n=1 Tax=Stieleria magnilauensis TaxID=2527963 RepID=A0ABX5Y054_9BACT|nr:hypothetical protein TBK1r_59280 [Planctomycetes bacterium TBK1r]QDV86979.1 hypothetical protein TBK1r_60060 [Planctomycetes bacterium TBK1r]
MITKQIRESLASAIQSGDITQAALSRASGVSKRAVCDFLAGRHVNSDSLDAIADAMRCKLTVPKSFARNVKKLSGDA